MIRSSVVSSPSNLGGQSAASTSTTSLVNPTTTALADLPVSMVDLHISEYFGAEVRCVRKPKRGGLNKFHASCFGR